MPYANIEDERERNAKRRKTEAYKNYQGKYRPEWYQANKHKYRKYVNDYKLAHPERVLFHVARVRARKKGLPFDIEESDIVIPAICPILGIPIVHKEVSDRRKALPGSPSVDRIVPHLGYVKGNVQVISWRANQLKNDATFDEIMKLAEFVIKRRGT